MTSGVSGDDPAASSSLSNLRAASSAHSLLASSVRSSSPPALETDEAIPHLESGSALHSVSHSSSILFNLNSITG